MNNIFCYAPKELTTDAFLNWLFIELNDNQNAKAARSFFYRMGLSEKATCAISDIEVQRQVEHTDLIVSYNMNGERRQALFENKTYSTFRENQLNDYKKKFPDFSYYKYLKLAFINFSERHSVYESGYEVIGAKTFYSALQQIDSKHYLIKQYLDFLEYEYILPLQKIESELCAQNSYSLFYEAQAQQFFLSTLYEELLGSVSYLFLETNYNPDGTPFTLLSIAKREDAYDANPEYLWWRIDMRSNKFYLRLNQWSGISASSWESKQQNLESLRSITEKICSKYSLKLGKVINKGHKESEVIIFFFEENELLELSKILVSLSCEISQSYMSTKSWV
ncbi:MAG: hypothetical protein DRR42_22535 [Gammaproteobacteria bacterium]|nr:MAG: hypothetical protein DRR42_22535 [Gammaproteobacteria bacterium]